MMRSLYLKLWKAEIARESSVRPEIRNEECAADSIYDMLVFRKNRLPDYREGGHKIR